MVSEKCATISIRQAAEILGICYHTALSLVKKDKFPGVITLGVRKKVVSRKAIDRLLEGSNDSADKETTELRARVREIEERKAALKNAHPLLQSLKEKG